MSTIPAVAATTPSSMPPTVAVQAPATAPVRRIRSGELNMLGHSLLQRFERFRTDPDAAQGFKQWLLEIAQRTAAAGKERGNFWGRGAVSINDAEVAALHEIAKTLDVPLTLGESIS